VVAVDKLLLRAEEVADLLSVGRAKVYLMISRRELPTVRIGRVLRVPSHQLREWIEQRAQLPDTHGATQPAGLNRVPDNSTACISDSEGR
jgi:excisionase family DNA binding protein